MPLIPELDSSLKLALGLMCERVIVLTFKIMRFGIGSVELLLGKPIFYGFYQNLAHMCQKLFSTDCTTFAFGAISFQFYKS